MNSPKLNAIVNVLNSIMNLKVRFYLDLGCSDGSLTNIIAKVIGAEEVYGVDIDPVQLREASLKGIKTYLCDLSRESLSFEDETFDLITAFDIIEHLSNPDNMLSESKRVLKRNGFLILSTPNLASWYNRVLLLMGEPVLGIDLSTKVRYKYPLGVTQVISGHVRLYTVKSLKYLLEAYGFKVIRVEGYAQIFSKTQVEGFFHLIRLVDKLFSRYAPTAANLLFVACKC